VPLKGNEGPSMVCFRCSRVFWPRVGSYWFLLLSPRGRCHFPGAQEARAVLCGPCGRVLREAIESNGFAPGEAVVNGTRRRRESDREGGPA